MAYKNLFNEEQKQREELNVKVDLHLGDCINILKSMPSSSIDLVVTDPPYEISVSHDQGKLAKEKGITFYKDLEDINNGFDDKVLDELVRVMKKINIYIFCSIKQVPKLIEYFVNQRGCIFNILCWHKTNVNPLCNNTYMKDTEYCLFFREEGVKLGGDWKTKATYYLSPMNTKDKERYKHPTCKPLKFISDMIYNSSEEGQTVLDPFMGSGTTGEACVRLKRNFIGIEIKEEYFKTAKERIYGV